MGKPVMHFEMWSENPDKTSDFYKKAFDWDIQFMKEMNYHLITPEKDQGIGGGMVKIEDGKTPGPGNMTMYISVEDLGAYRNKITEAGGKIIHEEIEVPGAGAFCLFQDPDGRVMGIWKDAEKEKGDSQDG